jgi:hypothetical protein
MSVRVATEAGVSASRGLQFSPGLRLLVYFSVNLALLVVMGIGIALQSPANPRTLYVFLLAALCCSPLLAFERLNGSYFLLAFYGFVYFVFFGLSDFMSIVVGNTIPGPESVLTATEAVILISGLGVFGGYFTVARRAAGRLSSSESRDWPFAAIIGVGIAFWLIGTLSLAYWDIFIVADRTNLSVTRNLENLGPGLTTVVMLGHLVQPLGILMLAYAYAAYRRRYMLPIILGVVMVQVVLGFVADFKGEAMSAGILVILAKIYVDGRLPKAWLLAAFLFTVIVFPVFQANRALIRGESGVSALQAATNLLTTLQRSFEAARKLQSGYGGAEYRQQSFWERSSLKGSVELVVTRTGIDVPFQYGATLTPIAATFIPGILWPDKPSIAAGQVFNRTFFGGDVGDTYISPSHVGEVYWNFGWIGIVVIMPLIGALLGLVAARFSGYPNLSLTGLLVMVVTIRCLVINSESSIANEYVVWLRSIAAITLLDLVFARVSRQARDGRRGAAAVESNGVAPARAARFPHLLN